MQNSTNLAMKNESFKLSTGNDNGYKVSHTNLLIFNELVSRRTDEDIPPLKQQQSALSEQSRQKLSRLAINDEGFIFNPNNGDSFQVSETGLLIISELRYEKSEEEIAFLFMKRFDVSLEDALRDITDFIANLKKFGLI